MGGSGFEIFGNTVHDVSIALGIMAASLVGMKILQVLLQNRIREAPITMLAFIQPYMLDRILTRLSYLLPLFALFIARKYLVIKEMLDTWITAISVGAIQVIILLALVQTIESLLESRLRPPEDRSDAENRLLSIIEKYRFSNFLVNLSITIRVLILVLPTITALNNTGYLNGAWMLPITLFAIGVVFIVRLLKERGGASSGSDTSEQENPVPIEIGEPLDQEDKDSKDRRAIIHFFLEIFKQQSDAPPGSASKFARIIPEQPVNHHIYELSVEIDRSWKSRRMTISRLGNETGSRSKCYYVIYDDHLVVKIPPVDIIDIEKYIQSLKKEARIAERLEIRECIIPSISVILKHVDSAFKKSFSLFSETGERYLNSLSKSPDLQKYLKIDNSFAFFMDLSEYYFLQHVIDEIHDRRKKMEAEIISHAEIAWDYLQFENRYSEELIPIISRLERMHAAFEKEIISGPHPGDTPSALSSYQIKKYLFVRLADSRDTDFEKMLPANILKRLETAIDVAFQRYQPVIEAYRKTILDSVTETIFSRNKIAMAGIATNLLVLLEHLQKRGVSLRDLKPDNLLVAGDRARYPNFLMNPNDYKIGIIDVETAVIYGEAPIMDLQQPQLGGTPMYATPAHFFPNRMLHNLLGDLPTSFHLQDWHATICIIYRVITGDFLFTQTGRMIPNILKALFDNYKKPKLLKASGKEVSRVFWRNAAVEFQQKMNASKKLLESIYIAIPDPAMIMIREFLMKEQQNSASKMEASISTQPLFSNEATRESFRVMPSKKIKHYARKLKSRKGIKPAWDHNKAEILKFFDNLVWIKKRIEKQSRMLHLLEQGSESLPVRQLLEIMFEVVLRHMYREEWKTNADYAPDLLSASEKGVSLRSTANEARKWQESP